MSTDEIVHQSCFVSKRCIVSISGAIDVKTVGNESISFSTFDTKINPFFRTEMEHLFKGLLGYHSDDNLHKPLGYSNTSAIHNYAYKLQTHKYRVKLCSDKTLFEKWSNVNLKAIGQLLALERSFCHFLTFQYYAANGSQPSHFPIKPQDFFKIKMYTGAAGMRHYTEVLQQNIVWLLGAENWFRDQKSLIVFHNFMAAVIKLNYGGQSIKNMHDNDFISTILTRADGNFEVDQLNILKNIVAKTAMPILKNIPALASFYQAFEYDIQSKAVFVNIEIVSTLKFPGMSTFVHNIYRGKGMNMNRLFSSEMLDKMNCPAHTQDSQKSGQSLSIENTSTFEPLMSFNPPSPNKVSSSDPKTILDAIKITSNPKPDFKRNVAHSEMKTNLNWNDVFGQKSNLEKDKTNSVSNNTKSQTDPPAKKSSKSKIEADLLPGDNSDDYFDSSMEYEDSTIILGQNKNDESPVFPIPPVLTSENLSQAPPGPSSFDLLSTSSDSQNKSQNTEGFLDLVDQIIINRLRL